MLQCVHSSLETSLIRQLNKGQWQDRIILGGTQSEHKLQLLLLSSLKYSWITSHNSKWLPLSRCAFINLMAISVTHFLRVAFEVMCPTSNLVWRKSVNVVCRNTLETVLVTQKAITQVCKKKLCFKMTEKGEGGLSGVFFQLFNSSYNTAKLLCNRAIDVFSGD